MDYPRVELLFCDDIREEVGGKRSLMGVYSDELIVKKFPSTISKLCVFVKLLAKTDNPITEFKIDLLKNDSVFESLPIQKPTISVLEENKEHQAIYIVVNLFGITIEHASSLEAHILLNNAESHTSKLAISLPTEKSESEQ